MKHSLRESIRAVCLLVIIIASIAGVLVWFVPDRPSDISWPARIGTIAVGVVALLVLLAMYLPRGKVPDQLRKFYGPYLECKGFCFVLSSRKHGELCELEVAFQNRQSEPCKARIVLRPTRKLFHFQDQTAITLEVDCPGGSFGRTLIPLPIDPAAQGSTQKMDIIAGVQYPNGSGETLHHGIASVTLGNKVSFETPFVSALSAVALLGGAIVTHQHASVEISFPQGVRSDLPKEATATTEVFWKYGDPPLDEASVI